MFGINCTALSQSESRNFFMYTVKDEIVRDLEKFPR